MEEKVFEKYNSRGADYHWKQIDKKNFFLFNAFVYAKYCFFVNALKKTIRDKEARIIDFGCGDGVQLYLIKKHFEKISKKIDIFGIDLSDEALAIANKKLKGTFENSSVYKSPFENNYFDVSIPSDVIEHIQEPKKMIEEMERVTKPGGIIMIGTPIKYTEKALDSMHVKEYFQKEFKSMFPEEKFKIINYTETHSLFFTLLYGKHTKIIGKNILLFRYLINIATILFNKNPFLGRKRNKQDPMSYQFIILKK